MRISFKQLRRLVVETEGGIVLGKIIDLEMDIESQAVALYKIRGRYRDPFPRREFLVSAGEVVTITSERMVVKDSSIPAGILAIRQRSLSKQETAAGVVSLKS